MLDRIWGALRRGATGRNILILLVLFLLFNMVLLPMAGARIESLSGGIGPLDLRFTYSPAEAYSALAAYGRAGRLFYLIIELTADLVYPIIYTLFFSLALTFLFQRGLPPAHPLQRAGLVPLAGLLFDLLENAGLALLLLVYPQELPAVAAVTAIFTLVKWLLALTTLLLMLAGIATLVRRRRRSRPAGAR
jgi:hypothetical protein